MTGNILKITAVRDIITLYFKDYTVVLDSCDLVMLEYQIQKIRELQKHAATTFKVDNYGRPIGSNHTPNGGKHADCCKCYICEGRESDPDTFVPTNEFKKILGVK